MSANRKRTKQIYSFACGHTVYLLLRAQTALIMNSVPFKHNFVSMQTQKKALTLQNLHKTNQKPSDCSQPVIFFFACCMHQMSSGSPVAIIFHALQLNSLLNITNYVTKRTKAIFPIEKNSICWIGMF